MELSEKIAELKEDLNFRTKAIRAYRGRYYAGDDTMHYSRFHQLFPEEAYFEPRQISRKSIQFDKKMSEQNGRVREVVYLMEQSGKYELYHFCRTGFALAGISLGLLGLAAPGAVLFGAMLYASSSSKVRKDYSKRSVSEVTGKKNIQNFLTETKEKLRHYKYSLEEICKFS